MRFRFDSAAFAPSSTPVLRVGVAWGTTVLVAKQFAPGQSVGFGDHPNCILPLPDGLSIAPIPIKAVGAEWQIDHYGATDGMIERSGRREDPARMMAPVRIGPGDWGVLQYGAISLFFQLSESTVPSLGRPKEFDELTGLCVASSALLHIVAFLVLWLLASPRPARPTELSSLQQLGDRFGLQRWIVDSQVVSASLNPDEAPLEAYRLTDYREVTYELKRALSLVRSSAPVARAAGQGTPTSSAVVGSKTISLVPAASGVWGGLAKNAIERVAIDRMSLLQSCGDAEVVPAAEFRGTVVLSLTVSPEGVVTGAETTSTPRRPKLEACVAQQSRSGWRYPQSSAPSNVKYTLRLGPASP